MVSVRRKPSVFLLAIAAMTFSLVLLSATSSVARTDAGDQGESTDAAGSGDECLDFGNGGSDAGSTSQDTGASTTGEDTLTGTNESDSATGDSATGDNADAANEDTGTTGGDTGTDTGTTSQDSGTGTDGENSTTSQDDGTGSENGTTSSSNDGGAGNGECVIADTVPNESLLPTGAPEKSRTDEKTAQKNSDGNGEQGPSKGTQEKTSGSSDAQKKTSGGTQEKTAGGGEAQRKTDRSETRSKSGSGGTTQARSDRSSEARKKPGGGTVTVRGTELKVDDRAGKEPRQEELKAGARSAAASDPAPRLAATEWSSPSREELGSAGKPRKFAPNPNAEMTLSARALGLYNMPITSSNQQEDLDNGLVRVPDTSLPWDKGDQKNVFIAGHYLGVPQTPSRLAFYNLHKLKRGDELLLKDERGQTYKYQVSEKFAVEPGDSWAMGQVRDRDMVTLQTCIPPDFGKRLVVRADRVKAWPSPASPSRRAK